MESIVIEPLARASVDEASRTLARAFDDSPLWQFLFPKPRARLHITAQFFRATILDALPFGAVHVARNSSGNLGTVCWLPPSGYPIGGWRQLVQFVRLATQFPRAPSRIGDSRRYLDATEQVHPKEMHWYLSLLGVDPTHQGEGLGARLIDHTLERLDRNEVPVYLETDKESNLAWYARRRFGLRETLYPVAAGPPVWTMWREPA